MLTFGKFMLMFVCVIVSHQSILNAATIKKKCSVQKINHDLPLSQNEIAIKDMLRIYHLVARKLRKCRRLHHKISRKHVVASPEYMKNIQISTESPYKLKKIEKIPEGVKHGKELIPHEFIMGRFLKHEDEPQEEIYEKPKEIKRYFQIAKPIILARENPTPITNATGKYDLRIVDDYKYVPEQNNHNSKSIIMHEDKSNVEIKNINVESDKENMEGSKTNKGETVNINDDMETREKEDYNEDKPKHSVNPEENVWIIKTTSERISTESEKDERAVIKEMIVGEIEEEKEKAIMEPILQFYKTISEGNEQGNLSDQPKEMKYKITLLTHKNEQNSKMRAALAKILLQLDPIEFLNILIEYKKTHNDEITFNDLNEILSQRKGDGRRDLRYSSEEMAEETSALGNTRLPHIYFDIEKDEDAENV